MGIIFSFDCKECHYHESYLLGGGTLTSLTGVINELYQCPKCGNLSVREKTIARKEPQDDNDVIEEEQRCEECKTVMNLVHEESNITCPNCHAKGIELRQSGWWD